MKKTLENTVFRSSGWMPASGAKPQGLPAVVLMMLAVMAFPVVTQAQIVMTHDDGYGTSSFNSANAWSDGLDPHSGTNYSTAGYFMRTPPDASDYAFKGDSLTLTPPTNTAAANGGFLYKGTAALNTYTITNLIDAGGTMRSGAGSGNTCDIAGNMAITADSQVWLDQSPYVLSCNISGTNNLTVANAYSGATLTLSGTNSAFTGKLIVNSGTLIIANPYSVPGNPLFSTPDQITLASTLQDNYGLTLNNANSGITLSGAATINTASAGSNTVVAIPITGGYSFTKTGAGTLTLSGANSYTLGLYFSAGQLNINSANALGSGGTFTIQGGSPIDNTSGSAVVNAGNNPMVWNNDFTFAGSSDLDLGTGAVTMGGNRNITVNGGNLTVGGAISGAYGLNKLGAGTLTLGGANDYTGNTTVTAGTLALSGSCLLTNSPTVTVNGTLDATGVGGLALLPSQVLQGSGTVAGAVTAATIYPGGSYNAGTLTIDGDLTVSGGALNFDLTSATTAGGGTNDLLVVSNLDVTASTPVMLYGPTVPGTYTLIKYTSISSGAFANLALSPVYAANGFVLTNNTSAKEIQLLDSHTSAPLTWVGDGVSNLWDIATSTNWNNGSPGAYYFDGDTVTFDDSGDNTLPVDLTTGLSPASVTVNGTKDYTFAGGGGMLAGSLTNNGSGTLTVSNANSYAGPTVINAGTVKLANGNALGNSSPVVLADAAGVTLNVAVPATIGSLAGGGSSGGNVTLDASSDLTVGANNTSTTFGGTVTGASRFITAGSGTLTLNGVVNPGSEVWIGENSGNAPVLDIQPGASVTASNWFCIGRNGATGTVNINGGSLVHAGVGNITLGTLGTNPEGTINLNSGSISNLVGETYLGEGSSAGDYGVYNQSGGTAYLGNLYVGRYQGNGDATITGGTLYVGNLDIARADNNTRIGTNTFTMGAGTTVNASGFVELAYAGSATKWGMLTNNGGVLNVGSGGLIVCYWDPCSAVLTLNSGAINLENSGSIQFGAGNNQRGNGTINQEGGMVTFYSDNGTTVGGTGSLNFNSGGGSQTTIANYTYNLDGGTLTVPSIQGNSSDATNTFNFNGGTLVAAGSTPLFMTNLTTVNVRNGGAKIDTAGYNVTIGTPLAHSSIPTDASTDGGLTKLGAGTLTLVNAFYYTGPTVVEGGTLELDPSLASGNGDLTVSNATLGLTLKSSGYYSGTSLYPPNVVLDGSAALNLDYGQLSANPSAPAIYDLGNLSVPGTVTINITANGLQVTDTNAAPNGFQLISWTSTATGTNNFTLGTLPPGITAYLTNTATSVNLVVTKAGQTLAWYGADYDPNTGIFTPNNNWDIGVSSNWYDSLNYAYGAQYLQYGSIGDNVEFNDTTYTGGANNVNITQTVSPATLKVDATSTAYSFTGSGSIAGAVTLNKTNAGSLYLATANSYTGGTVIGGGTLAITNDNALGDASGAVTLAGGTLELDADMTTARTITQTAASTIGAGSNATVVLSGSITGTGGLTADVATNASMTFSGDVDTGNWSLTKTNDGTLTLINTNNLGTGNFWVRGGAVVLDTGGYVTNNTWNSVGRNDYDVATMTIKGSGKFITGNDFNIGDYGPGAQGTLNIQDSGSLTCANLFVASANEANSADMGTVNQSGGTVTQTSASTGTFTIGGRNPASTNGVGIYNLSGGTVTASIGVRVGGYGTGTVNQSGGSTFDCSSGGINLARYAGSSGTYNLNGGTLVTLNVVSSTGNNAVFNFNGGTLKPATDNATFMEGLSAANVLANGAIIDTSTNTITINQALLDGGGGGGLTKLGVGTLKLSGANTFVGPIQVSAGALVLTSAHHGTNAVTTADGTTFGVVQGGALTLGNVTLSNSTVQIRLTSNTAPSAAVLNVGALSFNGTATLRLAGIIPSGTYPVIHYTSLAGTGGFDPTVAGPQGMVATLSTNTVNQTIDVNVTDVGGIVWDGTNPDPALTNLWDLNSTTNWLVNGSTPTDYQEPTTPPGDAVTFNDAGSGTVLLSNTASPSSVTISNVAVAYTFSGTGHISGSTGLTKEGAGSASINLTGNDYAGTTKVDDGTLSIAGPSGNSAVVMSTNADALLNITGAGAIGSLNGGGTNGGNVSFTGTLNVSGQSASTFDGNLTSANDEVNFQGTNDYNLSGAVDVGQFNVDNSTVNVTGTLAANGSAGSRIRVGRNAGNATMNIETNATVTGNWSIVPGSDTSTGTINVNGGTLIHQGGLGFYLGSGGSGSTGYLNLNTGTISNLVGGMIIGESGPSVGVYNQTGGTASLGGDINVGQTTNDNQLNILGGTATANTVNVGYGNTGHGTVTVSNASFSVAYMAIARSTASTHGDQGTVIVENGGILNDEGDLAVGLGGDSANGAFGTLLITNGGIVNVATTTTRWLIIGQYDSVPSTLTVDGGTLNLNANTPIRFDPNGGTGVNTINLNNGAITFYSGNQTGSGSTGVLDLNRGETTGSVNNTFNLNGGTLTLGGIDSTLATGTRVFNFNGGALKPTASSTTFFAAGEASAANVLSGGAVIDTAGFDISIGQPLLNGDYLGGGLTKNGAGALKLDGVNTYTGDTVVNAGTLGGSGTIAGNVIVNSGAGLAPGDATTLTISGNITLNSGSTNVFAVDGSTPANDQVVAGAGVTYGGVLQIAATGTFTNGQQFVLFSGAGATNSGNFASVVSTDPAITFSFTNGVLTVVSSVNPNPPQLQMSYDSSTHTMSLGWPTNSGWILQTNSVGLTTPSAWHDYPGSTGQTNLDLIISPSETNVFFRMVSPF